MEDVSDQTDANVLFLLIFLLFVYLVTIFKSSLKRLLFFIKFFLSKAPPSTCEGVMNCSNIGLCLGIDICICPEKWTGSACNIPKCEINICVPDQGICVGPDKWYILNKIKNFF